MIAIETATVISDPEGKVKMKKPLSRLEMRRQGALPHGMRAVRIIICTYIAPFNSAPQSGLATLIN